MKKRLPLLSIIASVSLVTAACQADRTSFDALGPSNRAGPLTTLDGREAIVVNPNANGNGVAATIQEGIDRVASGGEVLVMAGTYIEALTITKALTLRPIGDGSQPVVVATTGAPDIAIRVATSEPVVIQDLTVL